MATLPKPFFEALLQQARKRNLFSDERFTVDGTLLKAWAREELSAQGCFKNGIQPDDPGNGNLLVDKRHGLIVNSEMFGSNGTAERDAALVVLRHETSNRGTNKAY
jgi:hypothetical protein